MKPYQTLLCCWFVTILGLHAQRTTSTDLARRSTEVVLTPPSSDLAQGSRFVISFPEAMIPLDQIDIADVTSPLMFTPPLPGAFSWQSTTTGTYRVTGPVKPGQVYEVDLTADLEVSRSSWRASEFQAPPLEITSRFRSRGISLSASPRVDLRTNYRVHAAKAAETAYFQNRETRQRYPVSVILPEVDVEKANERIKVPDTLSRFHVTSVEPLPVGATYELVIDGLTDAGTGTPMSALKSISLGSTQALTISEVETITHPLDKPAVILSTTAPVDHDSLSSDSVRVTPPVENVTFFADDYDVRVKGDFDPSTTYEIALGPKVTSKTGYPIANPGPHKATFDGLTPIIVFPRSHFYQRSALGLNVTILQSNCPETTWRLAAIPLERFAVIESRLREHERAARDPFTGKIIGDFQTELLTDAFDLEITATGKLPGTASHEARYQDIRWQPQDGNLPVGAYQVQFRADIISPEGRVISSSNRTIIRPHSHYAAIQWTRASDDTPNDPALIAKAFAFDRQDREQVGLPVELTIYRRNTQTVKERLGSNVYRYRNYPNYHRIKTIAIKSGDSYPFTPEETGHYIAYAKLTKNPTAPAVSTTIHSVGDGVGSYDVYNDGEITLQLDKKRYLAGQDIAQIALEAPFGGQAWVTVETNRIIDQFLVNLPANNQTISLPIKPSYHPNVHVSVYLLHPGGLDRLPMERYGTTDITVDRPDLVLDVQPILTESPVQPGEGVTGLVRVHCQGHPVPGADLTILAVDDAVHRLGNWQMPDWFSQVYPKRYLGVAAYRGLGDHVSKFEERDVTEKGFIIGGGVDDAFSPADSAHSESPQSFRKDFRALAFWKTQVRTNANDEATFEFTAPDNFTSYHLVAIAQTKEHQFGQGESYLKVAKRLMVEPALTRFVRRGEQIELRAVVRQNYVDNAQVTIQCQVEGEIEWLIGSQNATIGLSKGLPQVVRFPCRILGGGAIKVSFQAHCEDEPSLEDAVELELPVRLPGIIQRTGHYGIISKKDARFPLYEKLPESWNSTTGSYDMTVSHTPYLPELNSMPEILKYPHGCFEQKATRYLSYTQMLSLLDYLPELKNRHANYRDRLQEGLAEYENAQLESGFIPYWSGGREPNDWVTVMAYWLTKSAKSQGVTVSVGLEAGLDKSFQTIVHGRRKRPDIHLTTRTFALFAYAETGHAVHGMQALITDLYARRGELSLDGLTLLTLAMNRFGVMEKEQAQLAKVLENEARERQRDFEPETFGSLYRDQALRWLTKTRLASLQERRNLSEAFLKHLEDQGTVTLSTQEHFWKTLLLKEFVEIEKDATFDQDQIQPSPDYVSANLVSIAWKTQPLEHLRDLKLDLATGNADRHYFIRAAMLRGGDVSLAEDRGFRLERVVTNLTDPKRVSTEETPYQIGDELLLEYRFHTRKHHYYVALSDELPAGIETANFNLPQIAQVYKLPGEAQPTIALDHSELRDQSANLYFDHVPPGNHRYAILARVTAAGSFAWPSTQISPMYQPHVGGLTASSNAHSRHGR